jgi:DNA mismatch repair protein MutL
MPKVKQLPPEVISKIAAGEIIERPASVVKEILENALDARADAIEIHLQDAGKTLIQIKDNGSGIEQDDMETIFHRHATSKIARSDDLFSVQSLGFRGEALYSVAAISDVVLKSKPADQETGFEIHIRGGQTLQRKPCPFGGHGTEIAVKELFFNTPARRKFLKSNTTELNHILNVFTNYTLLHHACRFRLTHQGKDLMELAPCDDPVQRAADTLRLDPQHLLTAQKEFSLKGQPYAIRLILGDINITRARRDLQFLFVNNRPVANKNISFHMNKTYRLIMPDGTFPFFAVFVDVPPSEVDVNIHPAKREVKVRNEHDLCGALRALCEQTLMTQSDLKQAGPFQIPEAPGPAPDPAQQARARTHDRGTDWDYSQTKPVFENKNTPRTGPRQPGYAFSFPSHTEPEGKTAFPAPDGQEWLPSQMDNLQDKLANGRFIGSFIRKYLLFEQGRSLFLIDQHAAAERIAYEHLITQIQKGKVETQMLLSPIPLKLSMPEMLFWEQNQKTLHAIGFETTLLDPETIAVHAYPQLITNIERSVRQLLAGEDISTSDPDKIARQACRSSVMSGDKLSPEQAVYQRDQLIRCLDPFTCPHGRPTVLEMTEDFLDKQFLR